MWRRKIRLGAVLCSAALIVGMLPDAALAAGDTQPEKLKPIENLYSIPALTFSADRHYTVLVVRKGANLNSLSADDIMYIGQDLADENGQVQFPSFGLRDETDVYVYIGGEGMAPPEQRYYIEADPAKVLKSLQIAALDALTIPKSGEVHSKVPVVTATAASGADMTPPSLVWSIDNGPFVGISINEDSGLLTVTGLASPNTITIRATHGRVSATQTAEIKGLDFSPAPDATITGMPESITLPYAEGDITLSVIGNAAYTYQWQQDSGNGIWKDLAGKTGYTYSIPADQVKVVNNGWRFRCNVTNQDGDLRPNTASQTVTLHIKKGTQSAPTDLIGVAPTTVGGSDGKITGLDPTKAYTRQGGSDITPVNVADNSTEITGLTAGTYRVKIKASDDFLESNEAKIVVPERSSDLIPVADITGVPASGTAGVPLTLAGTVLPENATNKAVVWRVVNAGTTGAVITGSVLTTVNPGALRIEAKVSGGIAGGDFTKEFDLTISQAPPEAYPVTIEVHKDGQLWDSHGKAFTLRKDNLTYTVLDLVPDGTYQVLENSADTGVTVTVDGAAATAVVDYYTVSFAALDKGLATGSKIDALYNGAPLPNNQVVLKGGRLVLTAAGTRADRYAYRWNDGQDTAELVVDPVDQPVNLTCVVTGSQEISGSLTIQGQPKYGETLSAVTADVNPAAAIAGLTYAWTRDSKELGTGSEYILTKDDIGQKVTLTVTGSGDYYGSLTTASDTVEKADQAIPTGVDKTDESAPDANNGTLTGLTPDMEYQRERAADWTPCPDGTVAGLMPGTYLVRYGETSTHHAGAAVTLHILAFDAPAPAPMPSAVFDAGTMRLTSVTIGMKYSVDGGAHWLDVDSGDVDLSGASLTTGTGIQIYQLGDGATTSDSDTQYITLTQAPAPADLSKSDVTFQGAQDGVIRGVTGQMEYRQAQADAWTACTGIRIDGLAAGDYWVRMKGSGTVLPSEAVAVTISVSSRVVSVTGVRLSKHSLSFYSNTGAQSEQLTATVLPESATDQAVIWSSTNTEAVTVNQKGLVTVVGNGSASVLATTHDGGFTDTCTVTVSTYTSGGGGGGGGGGGSSRPTVPEEKGEIKIETSVGTTTITIPVTKDQDRITVDRTAASRMAAAAAESGSGKMVIAAGDQTLPVELTADALDTVWSRKDASLTIQSGAAEITLMKDQMDLTPGVLTVDSKREENGQVTVSLKKGGKDVVRPILVALPVEAGNVALLVRPDGTEDPIPFSRMIDGVMYAAVDGSAVLKASQISRVFEDTKGHWAEQEAEFATAHGLFYGTSQDTFSPDKAMSRGMLMTVLYRMAGTPTVTEEPRFPDVTSIDWYEQAVAWGAEAGLASGVEDGRFLPDNSTSRAQFATLLYRFAQTLGMDTTTGSASLDAFTDAGQAEPWSSDALAWAVSQGIMQGRENGTLGSGDAVTRAEAAAMLERFISARLR